MPKVLIFPGHGKNPRGGIDPGATGFIKKGENRYFREDFLPKVRKYLPDGHQVVIFEDHDVYAYGDLNALAKKYGKDTIVIELHYDALDNTSAKGGHVIINKAYAPDALDLKLRDVIKKHIGVRYQHKNNEGISGRDNLANVNISKTNNINYRLIELGFGTNKSDSDIMVKNVDAIAKDFVIAVCGKAKTPAVVTPPTSNAKVHVVVKGDTLYAIAAKYKLSVDGLKAMNNLKDNTINPGQKLNVESAPKIYTVVAGDSLSKIGEKVKVKWQDIAKKNGINAPYIIKLGQKLKY